MKKVRWLGVFTIVVYLILFGILGLGLSETINKINGLSVGSVYGYFASHAVIAGLFWVFFRNTKLIESKGGKN